MSNPSKSPVPKSQSKKKKVNMNSLMLPGLDKLPTKKGGKPVVVVVVKGGKNPPDLSNIPFFMGGKIKKKKKSGKNKKSAVKTGDKKKSSRTKDDDSDVSDSDRVSAPELPKAHTQKGATTSSMRSDKSVTGISSTSTSNISMSNAPLSRTPQLSGRPSRRLPPPPSITADPVVIQGGIVDRPCVPMFMVIDGPAGCPIIVPLDARDESGLVPVGSPPTLTIAPSQDTKGYLIVEDGLLHFKPLKDNPPPPPTSTLGTLSKFLTNSNIFIADAGPQLPDTREINTATSATIKEKIGVKLAVSGYMTILAEKGTCKFTRVSAVTKPPFYPENAAMGVLVKDRSTSYLFWIPTENRFVGPLLSHNVKIPVKKAKEMAIMGNVYKDSTGILSFEAPSNKLDNLIGFIMSSATGVPIYAAKPEGVGSTTRPTPSPSSVPLLPIAATATPPPPPAAESPPPARDEISPPPVTFPSPSRLPPPLSPSPSAAPIPTVESPPNPPAPTGPSLGWSLLSTLGSVLSTTASVISTTAGAVTEAAAGAGASLPSSNQSTTTVPPPASPSAPIAALPPTPSAVPLPPVATPTPTKTLPTVKTTKKVTPSSAEAADEEAALAAEEATADAASNGGTTGVTIAITVRDSNSSGGKTSDQKSSTDRSDGESYSDASSEGGIQIGDQMASIYRNLLSSQNELPPDPEPEHKEEEVKSEEKVERKARSSLSEENRRKAETTKEYKKYMDDRSVSFSPYGYR